MLEFSGIVTEAVYTAPTLDTQAVAPDITDAIDEVSPLVVRALVVENCTVMPPASDESYLMWGMNTRLIKSKAIGMSMNSLYRLAS